MTLNKACDIYVNYTLGVGFLTGICLLLFVIYKLKELKSDNDSDSPTIKNKSKFKKAALGLFLFSISIIILIIHMYKTNTKEDRLLMCERSFINQLIGIW